MTDNRTATERPVTTWADGWGVWHADVPLSTEQTEREAARDAIWAELSCRGAAPAYAKALRVVRERETIHGTVRYREV